MSAVTSPYGPTEMLSESVYNFAASRRAGAEQDSDSQLQLAGMQKPRNKRKNFKPINSRMAEVSDEDDQNQQQQEQQEQQEPEKTTTTTEAQVELQLEFERKTMLHGDDRPKQRLNNNESSCPMDLSVTPRAPSSLDDDNDDRANDGDNDDDDESNDSFKHKVILEQLRSQKLYSPEGTSEKFFLDEQQQEDLPTGSPDSVSSSRSGSVGLDNQEANDEESENERRPYDNMQEYAESTMQELLAIYGLAGSGGGSDLAKNLTRHIPANFLNPQQQESRVKSNEDKDTSSMAPGSPPTPPHTPQSPPRQNLSGISTAGANLSQSSRVESPNSHAQTSSDNSPLGQILAQNPALAQLLQQNPAILSQNPQLAQLLQQNLQVHLSNTLFPRRDDSEDARVPGLKIDTADPKITALLQQSMSPVSAESLLGGSKSGVPQPVIDYSRYVRRYSSGQECGSSYCKDLGCREHFHCLDCSGRVFIKKEEMIRHFKWHKKRDESLQHGFLRYSPSDDCSENKPHRSCPHNRKQTHYHCVHDNCDKVYISTSDVQMHANYHRKDSAIIQEGFQRFRATETCATPYCPFASQRTTHFHCRRSGCRYTFKNKADMDKHKTYHIKDEQLTRDGFKKFMKSEPCPFEQCKFSKVCNHIHCIRPQCNYVLHSSGQLFSHKRKHERNDSEVAYRKYKQTGTRPPGWTTDDPQGLSLSLNGESSSDDRGSPAYYSLDDSFQSASDLAMDLTAAGGSQPDVQLSQLQQQQLTPTELSYLTAVGSDCSCGFGREHYHCIIDRCGTALRDPREVREHLREHETQERITDAFFEEGGCDESCPYADKEKHYHCNWENCREVILPTDKPFRRLQHYKIHEYSQQLDLTCVSQPLSSDVTLTHLTNIDEMFRRKRGRPPKNRVIEIWSGDSSSHGQDSPQAVFTSFKLPKPTAATVTANSTPAEDRESSVSPVPNETVGFSTYGIDGCPDMACGLRSSRHHHCCQPRCHFSTDRPDQLLMHSKDFHDNVEILPGFDFFDRTIDCRLPGCQSNRINRHFHCTRPNCGYTFVRYSNMIIHEKQHSNVKNDDESGSFQESKTRESQQLQLNQEIKPRIQVKNPADLIEKRNTENIDDLRQDLRSLEHKDLEISSPDMNKTTVVRAAGTFYPVSGPPCEPALPNTMLSIRASVHQESSSVPSAASVASHILYGPEQSCSRPFCKLKRKNHYHCNHCNQAFSELDRLVSHIAKHSTGAILSQQQHETGSQGNNHSQFDIHLSQKHDFMTQNIQSFQNQMQRQMQQSLGQMNQQQQQKQQQQIQSPKSSKEIKLDSPRCSQESNIPNVNNIKREQPEGNREDTANPVLMDNSENGQLIPPMPPNIQQPPVSTGFDLDLGHGFHFPSPAVMAAMNQQIALMNQALPPFLQHGSMYPGGPGLMFAPGLPPGNFLPPSRDENPLASLAANLNLSKRPLSPDSNSPESKKQRLHHSMRMLKDEPVPEGYIRFRFNEDCRYPHCGYREHQTHFHCMRQDCGYSFCDKTRFVQHTARHERLDTLMGGDFQQYRANVPCGRGQCAYTSSLGSMQNKASHFHCLKCDFVCTDTNKVVAHRRQHAKLDSIAAAGFQKFTPSQQCGSVQCQHSGKQTHYHCLQCQYAVLGLAQMSAHKFRHMDA